MTTTKTENKTAPAATSKKVEQADLQTAYEIHTLAQLVYAQIATVEPWRTSAAPLAGFQQPMAWMPSANTGAAPMWPGFNTWPW